MDGLGGYYDKWNVRQRTTNTIWSHLCVEFTKQSRQTNKTKLMGMENRGAVARRESCVCGGEMHVGVRTYRLQIVKWISHGGMVCCILVTMVGGIVVYIWSFLGEWILKILMTREKKSPFWYFLWWWMMTRFIVVIISQCMPMWNHYVVYLKLT